MSDLFLPAPHDPPDPEFRETRAGGHALILEHAPGHAIVVEYGDCEFWVSCQCGHRIALPIRPDRPLAPAVRRVILHSPAQRMTLAPHCQCGTALARPVPAFPTDQHLKATLTAWEQHTLGGGQ